MTFDVDELLKIRNANSGYFGKRARLAIANGLHELKPNVDALNSLQEDQYQVAIRVLISKATAKRKATFRGGASSYGNAKWATAAARECWLQNLALGSTESKVKVEEIIAEMMIKVN
jgi:hypothetical protein